MKTVLSQLVLVLAFALSSSQAAQPPSADPSARSFRMGFTPFPYDLSVEAIDTVRRLVQEHADIVSIHFEGVPWAEAHQDTPFDNKIMEDWKRLLAAKPQGGKVFLSLSPLNNGRSGLAGYRAAEENLPLPEPFTGKTLDDPIVVEAYLGFCRRAVRYFSPDYLAIGIEVNELFHNNRSLWPNYTNLHTQVYQVLKQENPKLPIFVTFTLHNLLNPDWNDREEMLTAAKQLMAHGDRVAISFYPFMAMVGGQMHENFSWLTKEFNAFDKPYVFSETGQPAQPVVLKSLNFTIPADPTRQHNVLKEFLGFAQGNRVDFFIWFLPRDYDGLWMKIEPIAPESFGVWRDCGLWDGEGVPRPALDVWQEYFQRPLLR